MRVLVTGGNGFIGAQALGHLADRGHDACCLDVRPPSPIARAVGGDVAFRRGDVTDAAQVYDAVAAFEPDRVLDFASLLGRESQADPRRAASVNLQGSLNVLAAAEALGVERVVTAASVAVYGETEGDTLTEDTPRTPANVYGMTKYALEHLGSVYGERGVGFAALEPVHGLGPDRRRGNVEDAYVCKAAVAGEPLTVPRIERPIEIVYVVEEAGAFVDAVLADDLAHDRYIVGTGERATLAEIVGMVRERVPGADLELREERGDDQLEGLPPTDPARIREDLGWEAEYGVRETVDAYIDWLEANPGKWSFDPADVPWE